MLRIVFTLDYEIHGNGEGCPYSLMVEPTERLLNLFDRFGAKLTIFADVAEIVKFKKFSEDYERDDFFYKEITEQLKSAVSRGHDVQLHIHSSYYNSEYKEGRWLQDWSEYNLSSLNYERVYQMICEGKMFLENLLREVSPRYKCYAFRAANWSMSPSLNIYKALVENGMLIDTSIFKYGKRSGRVSFDYSDAFSETLPWPVKPDNACHRDPLGDVVEFPIYSENRRINYFFSTNRFYRVLQSAMHRHEKVHENSHHTGSGEMTSKNSVPVKLYKMLKDKHAWKLDFNQCTASQMVKCFSRISKNYKDYKFDIPVVLIGHSKLFNGYNEKCLSKMFKNLAKSNIDYRYSNFYEFNLNMYR